MLIETIKNHPCGRREETLKMATLPGHTVDMPDVRARVPECRLINSRWIYGYHDIVVSPSLSLSFSFSFVSHEFRIVSPFCLRVNFSKIEDKTIDFTRRELRNLWIIRRVERGSRRGNVEWWNSGKKLIVRGERMNETYMTQFISTRNLGYRWEGWVKIEGS